MLVLFADESKGQEAGAFLKEDGGILIFLDPSAIDMSDPKQVFNGLMYEMNHYNPTNPYVYDKSEKNVEKGYKLEEDFTGIGRKPITDSENRFYYENLKGSDILKLGNIIYSEIDDKDLDNSLKEPDDDKFTRSYVNEYQKCHTGGKDSSCYNKVDRNAKIAEQKVPRTKPGILCGKACQKKQEEEDKKREAEFVKAMNSEIDLSVFGGSPGALNSHEQEKALKDFKENASYNGIPDSTKIIFKTETGEKATFDSFEDFQHWGAKQEKEKHEKYAELGTEAFEKARAASTKEEKKKYEDLGYYYYSFVTDTMQDVQNRQSLAGNYTTGNYLVNSALSYDGRTLVVSAEKYAGEIGAEHIGIFFEGTGKIATGIWANKNIKTESNLSSKNNNNEAIKYDDKAYNGERNPDADFTNKKGKTTLTKHVADHGKDFGVTSEKEYLNLAQNFLEKTPTSTTQSFVSSEGTYFRYDTATNEFGIINKFGGVSTYFKPDEGLNYWLKQIIDYAPK